MDAKPVSKRIDSSTETPVCIKMNRWFFREKKYEEDAVSGQSEGRKEGSEE